jgi:hypothetical protein
MPADGPIAGYVRELGPRLGGSWLRRRRIIAEVRAHLSEAVASDPLAEQDPAAAARRAIARFGTVEEVAEAFAAGRERGFGRGHARLAVAAAAAALVGAAIATPLLVLGSGQGPSPTVSLNGVQTVSLNAAGPHHRPHQAAEACPINVEASVAVGSAARYLGLTGAQLRGQLQAGKSLAQVAGERHESVAGLRSTVEEGVRRDARARIAAGLKRIPKADRAKATRIASRSLSQTDDAVSQMVGRPRLGVPPGCPGRISGQPSF